MFIYSTNPKETHLLTHECYWVINTAVDNLRSPSHRDACEGLIIPHSASDSVFGLQDSHLKRQTIREAEEDGTVITKCSTNVN